MKIKLDENLGNLGTDLLRNAGHDVATVFDEDLCSAADPIVISVCQQEARCLVTLDLDFANPIRFDPLRYSGIAVLRLPPRVSSMDLEDAIRTLIQALSMSDITGKLWVVRKGRVRVYQREGERNE